MSYFSRVEELVWRRLGIRLSRESFEELYLPLVEQYVSLRRVGEPFIVSFSGPPGCGKTVTSVIIALMLQERGFSTCSCSLDDFYRSSSVRRRLRLRNPFFANGRGLAGTHKVGELSRVLSSVKCKRPVSIPVFDKSVDDGFGAVVKKRRVGVVDFFIIEGWCVGLRRVSRRRFLEVVSKDVVSSDALGVVDAKKVAFGEVLALLEYYERAWSFIDHKTLFVARSLSWVVDWRLEQEHSLSKKSGSGMSDAVVKSFVLPFLPFCSLLFSQRSSFEKVVFVGKSRRFS